MKLSIRSKLIFLLLFIITIVVVLTARQTLEISLKDMSNNAKFISRNYSNDISQKIKERLTFLKQKTLFIVVNDDEKLNEYMFLKTPELIATIKYKVEDENKVIKQNLLINSKYEKQYSLDEESFNDIYKSIDFKSATSEGDFLKVGSLKNYVTDVVFYGFFVKAKKSKAYLILNVIVPDVMFSSFLKSEKSKYENFLINMDGNVVFHQDSSKVNLNISEEIVKEFTASNLNEITKEIKKEELKGYISSITKIPNTNLGVVSKIEAKDAYQEAQVLKYTIFITAFFIFLIASIISIIFARTLIKPLLKLASITKEIAKGNFLAKVDIESSDEIGGLAKSFKTMGTELFIREQKLKEAQVALIQSEKMSAFGQISAGIAHEVKNPLTGVLGHAQLVRDKINKNIEPEKYISSIDIIERETKRCKTIIENLMKFSRKEETVLKPENLTRTVEDSVKLVDHQLTINGVKIKTQILKGLRPVKHSPNQIEQVLMNLMINAGHAMEKSQTKELSVSLFAQDEKTARIEISDTGKGMSEEVRRHIFEPFFTTKPSGQGTGLGLSVSYGIVESHKGKIKVESKEGEGTTFKIDLPFSEELMETKEIEKAEKKVSTANVEEPITIKEKEHEQVFKSEIKEQIPTKPPIPKIEKNEEKITEKETKKEEENKEEDLENAKQIKEEKQVDSDLDFDIKVPRPKRKG
jgi:signal transduction histidine kinase